MKILEHQIRTYSLYELAFFFVFYSVMGWLFETLLILVQYGVLADRGFLYSPLCPIYGVSIIIAVLLLEPYKRNLMAIFGVGALLATLIEYVVGTVLLDLFGKRWWDYSTFPLNYEGHVSLPVSILWGVFCVLIIRYLHPRVIMLTQRISYSKGRVVLLIISMILIIDNAVSILKARS